MYVVAAPASASRANTAQLYVMGDGLTLDRDHATVFPSYEEASRVRDVRASLEPAGNTEWTVRRAVDAWHEARLDAARRHAHEHPELVDDHSDADPGL